MEVRDSRTKNENGKGMDRKMCRDELEDAGGITVTNMLWSSFEPFSLGAGSRLVLRGWSYVASRIPF